MTSELLETLHALAHRRRQSYQDARAAWESYRAYAATITAMLPFLWQTVGCDNPTQNHTGQTNGADHLVVRQRVALGRLVREPGDALCKPADQFNGNLWGDRTGQQPTCKRCLEIAERLAAPNAGVQVGALETEVAQ